MNLGSIQIRLPAAVTVLGAGDTASGPVPPAACGSVYWAVGGARGRPGVWQRSWQTSHGPRCGRDCVLLGSWPKRLSGQEENPKGCTGEDQVHPRRPERGDVKWAHRSLRHGLQASGSSPWGGSASWRPGVGKEVLLEENAGCAKVCRQEKECACVYACVHITCSRAHTCACVCVCMHMCAFVHLWICVHVCLCVPVRRFRSRKDE